MLLLLAALRPPRPGRAPTVVPQASASRFFSAWRPLYMPLLRSMWCGRRSSPESLSSIYVGCLRASAERRIPRLEGETFRFGTAIAALPNVRPARRRQALMGPIEGLAYRAM